MATSADTQPPVLDSELICQGMYYLRHRSDSSPVVRELVSLLTNQLAASVSNTSPDALCRAVEGLQNFHSQHIETRNALTCIVSKLDSSSMSSQGHELSMESLGRAMSALRYMGSDVEEVCAMLRALSKRIYQNGDTATSEQLALSFHGLQSMNAMPEEVRTALSALVAKVDSRGSGYLPMSPSDIAMSMYGLKSMRATIKEVRSALRVFAEHIEMNKLQTVGSAFSAQDVDMIFYGLKNMSDSCPEVRSVLSAMRPVLRDLVIGQVTPTRFSSKQLSNIIYGINSMDHNSPELLQCIGTFNSVLVGSGRLSWEGEHVQRALYGIRGLRASEVAVQTLIAALRQIFSDTLNNGALFGNRSLVNTVYSLREIFSAAGDEGRILFVTLCKGLNTSEASGDPWDRRMLSKLLFSMSSFSDESDGIISALREVVPLHLVQKNTGEPLPINSIGNALVGMRNMSCNSREVKNILTILASELHDSKNRGVSLTTNSLVNSFRGISSMTSKHAEVLSLVQVLGSIGWPDRLNASELGECYFGLNGMSSENSAVRTILSQLLSRAIKIPHSEWTSSDVLRCLGGMRGMRISDENVKESLVSFQAIIGSGKLTKVDVRDIIPLLKAARGSMFSPSDQVLRHLMTSAYSMIEKYGMHSTSGQISLAEAAILLGGSHFIDSKVQVKKLTAFIAAQLQTDSTLVPCTANDVLDCVIALSSAEKRQVRRVNNIMVSISPYIVSCQYDGRVSELLQSIGSVAVMDPNSIAARSVLAELCKKLQAVSSEVVAGDLISMLIALKGMSASNPLAQTVLRTVLVLTHDVANMVTLSPAQLAMGIGSIGNMSNDDAAVRGVVAWLTRALSDCTEPFTMKDIAVSLSGLQHMNSGTREEVLALLSQLAKKIENCHKVSSCSPFHASLCLNALQNFSCKDKSTRLVMKSLVSKLETCPGEFTGADVSSALFGVNNMSDECEEVRLVLDALTSRIRLATTPMATSDLLQSIYCLKSMHHNSAELKTLIGVLADLLATSHGPALPKDICSALFGMQGKSCTASDKNMSSLLSALELKLRSGSRSRFRLRSVGAALFGLSHIGGRSDPNVNIIMFMLIDKLLNCTDPLSALDVKNIASCLRSVAESPAISIYMAAAFNKKFADSGDVILDAKAIGMCMKSLQGLDASAPEVLLLVNNIALSISRSVFIQSNAVLRSISYVGNMSTRHAEVKELLAVLTEKLNNSSGHYELQDVEKSFNAVDAITTEGTIEHSFIVALTKKTIPFMTDLQKGSINIPLPIENELKNDNIMR